MRRKKWWAVSVFEYSFKVQFFYYLAVLLIVIAVPAIMDTQFFPLRMDSHFMWSTIFVIAFIFSVWRFALGAKKEYVERNLG